MSVNFISVTIVASMVDASPLDTFEVQNLNVRRIGRVLPAPANAPANTNALINYYETSPGGVSCQQLYVEETVAAILAAANAASDSGENISVDPAVAATAGGTQTAYGITAGLTNVITVTTDGDSVVLPGAIAGAEHEIVNSADHAMDVFPGVGDKINGGTTNAAYSIAPGQSVTFTAIDGADWKINQAQGARATITAHAGGGQSSAVVLSDGYNLINICTTAADSVKLPSGWRGRKVVVKNIGVASANVYPPSSGTLNGGSANAALPQGINVERTYTCIDGTNWETSNEVVQTDSIIERTSAAGVSVAGATIKNDGSVKSSVTGLYAVYSPLLAPQALSGAGACNLTTAVTNFTSTGAAQALTLADGVVIGHTKKIYHIVDGGSGVLTLTGYTSITFTNAADYVTLRWNGTAWVAIEYSGVTIV